MAGSQQLLDRLKPFLFPFDSTWEPSDGWMAGWQPGDEQDDPCKPHLADSAASLFFLFSLPVSLSLCLSASRYVVPMNSGALACITKPDRCLVLTPLPPPLSLSGASRRWFRWSIALSILYSVLVACLLTAQCLLFSIYCSLVSALEESVDELFQSLRTALSTSGDEISDSLLSPSAAC